MIRSRVLLGAVYLLLGVTGGVAQAVRAIPRPPARAPAPPKSEEGSTAPDGYTPLPESLAKTRATKPASRATSAVHPAAERFAWARC
jgi:hypothetical protein